MDYNFIKFEGRNKRQENRITVTKSQGIGFPTKFYDDNNIKDFKYVILYWDESNKTIALQFTNDEKEKNSFSILRSKLGYGGSILARAFFKLYNIDTKKYYGRYDWKKQNIDGMGEVYTVTLEEHQN